MTSPSPLLSVVIVCKDAADTIEKTFQSIASQTGDEVEYLVMDGASTDGTVELINQYEYAIDHWQSKPDESPYQPWNEAQRIAKGQYITQLNADDWYGEDTVEKLLAVIRSHEGVDIISFQLLEHRADEDGNLAPYQIYAEPKTDVFDLETALYCHCANKVYRRELLVAFGGCAYQKYPQMADRELVIRLGMRPSSKAYIDAPLYHFLVHDGSNTRSGDVGHALSAMGEYKKIAKDHIAIADTADILRTMERWYCFSSIRYGYFLFKKGRFGKAIGSVLVDFFAYPLHFINALVYLRVPSALRPKEVDLSWQA